MFDRIISEEGLFATLPTRRTPIKDLSKLPALDALYLRFLATCTDVEFTPDIRLFGYEEALAENHALESDYPKVARKYWAVGDSGQGDSWFLERDRGIIFFFDHDEGEYSEVDEFENMEISFLQFLQMASLYRELEEYLEENKPNEKVEKELQRAVDSIAPDLYDRYPFGYF